VQLYRYFVSQSNEFCRHNSLCCFSTSVYCCYLFCYYLVRKLLDTPSYTQWNRWNYCRESKFQLYNLQYTCISSCFQREIRRYHYGYAGSVRWVSEWAWVYVLSQRAWMSAWIKESDCVHESGVAVCVWVKEGEWHKECVNQSEGLGECVSQREWVLGCRRDLLRTCLSQKISEWVCVMRTSHEIN
jgi:hypothetical protein